MQPANGVSHDDDDDAARLYRLHAAASSAALPSGVTDRRRLTAICRLFICSLKPTQQPPPPRPRQLAAPSKVIFPRAAMMPVNHASTSPDMEPFRLRGTFALSHPLG